MTTSYVYKWTHIPTLKWYVGVRTKKGCHTNDGYICSSSLVKPLIKNNPDDWRREIVATGSKYDMLELETTILTIFNAAKDTRSFNRHNSNGKFYSPEIPWNKGIPRTKEVKEVIGKKAKLRFASNPIYRKIVSEAHKGKPISIEHKEALLNSRRGMKDSAETTLKKSLSQKGRIFTKEHKTKIKDSWDNGDHKVKLYCINCHREISYRLLGKHQWGSRCKKQTFLIKKA